MRTFASLCLVFILSVGPSVGSRAGATRHRRSLLDFAKMIIHATGRNPFDYNGYGCHCGIGGRGKPVDDLDRCCEVHDSCYADLKKRKICNPFQVYLLPYKTSSPLVCDNSNSRCAMGLCECDRDAALCFREKKFNKKYKNYNKLEKCFFQLR